MKIHNCHTSTKSFITLISMFMLILLLAANPAPDSKIVYGKAELMMAAPTFSSGTRVQANGGDLKVDTYATVPCVVDWNEDGKKDLLVGCFYYGNVYLYLNSGTNSSPVFTTGSKLQADGTDISVAYG